MGAESCQDDLYKEIRVENTLQDEDGEPVPDAVDFPVATPFSLPHLEKLAIYLANIAQRYANRLMKRLSTRSAPASLAKGIAS